MRRWRNIANAILGQYAGTEATFTNAGARFSYSNSVDRIVCFPTEGSIGEPTQAAKCALLEELEPNALVEVPSSSEDRPRVDDLIFQRNLNVAFEIWAPADKAEDRLHGLLCAIDAVCNTTLQVTGLREMWPQQGDITSGGSTVYLFATFVVWVVKSDELVLSEEAPIGSGTPTAQVTTLEIVPKLEGETLPTITTTEEIET